MRYQALSEEQLSALIAKLKDDPGLLESLKGATDLDAALAIAKEAGFSVSKADWLRHQAKQTLALSDSELERMAGGKDSFRCGSAQCETANTKYFDVMCRWCKLD